MKGHIWQSSALNLSGVGICQTKNVTLTKMKYVSINHGHQRCFFQFDIIINVLVSSFWFIWIQMLWVYGQYKCLVFSVRGPSLDVRIWSLKTVPALKGLTSWPLKKRLLDSKTNKSLLNTPFLKRLDQPLLEAWIRVSFPRLIHNSPFFAPENHVADITRTTVFSCQKPARWRTTRHLLTIRVITCDSQYWFNFGPAS